MNYDINSAARKVHQLPPAAGQFPTCVSDVLNQITAFVRNHGNNPNKSWNRAKAKELQGRIDIDLFCLGPDRRTRLNSLQRLKLLGIVCTYFSKEVSKEANPQLKYLYFDVIFCGREGEAGLHDARINFLTKLTVLALQYPVYELFHDIAQWLGKIGSGKTRDYAEQLVYEIADQYILVPERYKLYEYILPLNRHSFDFAVYFIIFSVSKRSLGPALVEIIGSWLCNAVDEFLRIISGNVHLTDVFCSEKFNFLLGYDLDNSQLDESHHRFHYVITAILLGWRRYFGTRRATLSSLLDKFKIEFIAEMAGELRGRFFEDAQNCALSGLVTSEELRKAIDDEKTARTELPEQIAEFFERISTKNDEGTARKRQKVT